MYPFQPALFLLRYRSCQRLWYPLTFYLLHNVKSWARSCEGVLFGIVRRKFSTDSFIGTDSEMMLSFLDVESISSDYSYRTVPVSWKTTLTTSCLFGVLYLRPVAAGKFMYRYFPDWQSYGGEFATFHYNRHEDELYVEEAIPVMEFIQRLIRHIPGKSSLLQNFSLMAYRHPFFFWLWSAEM